MTGRMPFDDQEPRFEVERRAGRIAVKLPAPVDHDATRSSGLWSRRLPQWM